MSDDQDCPDLGCIGSKPLITPNLDKLAAAGVRGTSFYVTWPACTPSRGGDDRRHAAQSRRPP
ncbi:MAG: sulfatase-like hydrolase/transferase [Verrucomicrobiota bacterium]|nr:sulfatase-like hydrolase/transferase [Verrucomicrobiota bacterium]